MTYYSTEFISDFQSRYAENSPSDTFGIFLKNRTPFNCKYANCQLHNRDCEHHGVFTSLNNYKI